MFFSSYAFERKFWNCLYLFRENRDSGGEEGGLKRVVFKRYGLLSGSSILYFLYRGTTGERGTFSVGFKD